MLSYTTEPTEVRQHRNIVPIGGTMLCGYIYMDAQDDLLLITYDRILYLSPNTLAQYRKDVRT